MWVFKVKLTRIGMGLTDMNAKESFVVGFFDPQDDFNILYEFEERVDAAQKVHFLNGGD